MPSKLTYEEWEQLMRGLQTIGRGYQWWIGDGLNFGERAYGEKYAQAIEPTGLDYQTLANYRWVCDRVEFSLRRENLSFEHHKTVAALEPAEQRLWLDKAESEGWTVRELRAAMKFKALAEPVPPPLGRYSCLVIDPPWPMAKIEREVRPKQGSGLAYPVMSEQQLLDEEWLPVRSLLAADAHVYLWVTHRFLPLGLKLLEAWGVDYQCVMTWRKNVGITPFSWMYDTEHVLFGTVGSLKLSTLGLRLSFEAKVVGHSVKPDVFYERVLAASPGPRLDMFARRQREGFEVWGDEV